MNEVGTKLRQMMEIADELFADSDIKVSWVSVNIEHKDMMKQLPKEVADRIKQAIAEAGFKKGEKEFSSTFSCVEQDYEYPSPVGHRKVTVRSVMNEAEHIERLEKEREALDQRIEKLHQKSLVKDSGSERSAV